MTSIPVSHPLTTPAGDDLAQVQRQRKRVVLVAGLLVLALVLCTRSVWSADLHELAETIGYGLIFLCIAGRCWSALYIGGRKKTQLVAEGPYSISRNPLYLFSLLGSIGVGLQSGSLTVAVMLGLLVFGVFHTVILREEAFLRSRFPVEFAAYAGRVPRWGPRLSRWQSSEELLVRPRLVLLTFRDALWFIAAVPVMEAVEMAQRANWLPVLLHLP